MQVVALAWQQQCLLSLYSHQHDSHAHGVCSLYGQVEKLSLMQQQASVLPLPGYTVVLRLLCSKLHAGPKGWL